MRIAAIYDVHGNLPALEATLAEIRHAAVDIVVVGGDVVPGPMPREAVSALTEIGLAVRFIHGNGEREILRIVDGHEPSRLVPAAVHESMRWVARQLLPAQLDAIRSWPSSIRLELPGLGETLFCHATPRSDTEVFTRATPEPDLLPLFEPLDLSLVVCGHTHMQFDRSIGTTRVVNAGSVGMRFGGPGADWLLLDREVELRTTSYDTGRAAERIRRTEYPQASEFVEDHVLASPDEAEMVERFEKVALRSGGRDGEGPRS